jgi:predicted lipoprotein with Yx(FWY)xxD motif
MTKKYALFAFLPAALLSACASMYGGGAAPAHMRQGMLVDSKDITLYTFDRDVAGSGKSACNGDCAVKWPPLLASASDRPTGDYTIVARADGKRQWAYRGKPLYTWPEDDEPGDKYGDDYNKVWHIVR